MLEDESDIRLGTLLEKAGLVTSGDIAEAVAVSKRLQTPIGRVLIMSGCVTERTLTAALEAQVMLREKRINLEASIEALVRVAQEKISLKDALRKTDKIPQAGASTNRLGEILIQFGLINKATLDQALRTSAETGMPLGSSLVCLGAISPSLLPLLLRTQDQIREGSITIPEAVQEFREAYAMWTKAKESVKRGTNDSGLHGASAAPAAPASPASEPPPIVASNYQDYYRKLAAQSFPPNQPNKPQKPPGYQSTPAEFANYQPKGHRPQDLNPARMSPDLPATTPPATGYPQARQQQQPLTPTPPPRTVPPLPPAAAASEPPDANDLRAFLWPPSDQGSPVQQQTPVSEAPHPDPSGQGRPHATEAFGQAQQETSSSERIAAIGRLTDVAIPSFERMASKQQYSGSSYSPASTSFDMPASPAPEADPTSNPSAVASESDQTAVLPTLEASTPTAQAPGQTTASQPDPPVQLPGQQALPSGVVAASSPEYKEAIASPDAFPDPHTTAHVVAGQRPRNGAPSDPSPPVPAAPIEARSIPLPEPSQQIASPDSFQDPHTTAHVIAQQRPRNSAQSEPSPPVPAAPIEARSIPLPEPSQHRVKNLPLPPAVLAAISAATRNASVEPLSMAGLQDVAGPAPADQAIVPEEAPEQPTSIQVEPIDAIETAPATPDQVLEEPPASTAIEIESVAVAETDSAPVAPPVEAPTQIHETRIDAEPSLTETPDQIQTSLKQSEETGVKAPSVYLTQDIPRLSPDLVFAEASAPHIDTSDAAAPLGEQQAFFDNLSKSLESSGSPEKPPELPEQQEELSSVVAPIEREDSKDTYPRLPELQDVSPLADQDVSRLTRPEVIESKVEPAPPSEETPTILSWPSQSSASAEVKDLSESTPSIDQDVSTVTEPEVLESKVEPAPPSEETATVLPWPSKSSTPPLEWADVSEFTPSLDKEVAPVIQPEHSDGKEETHDRLPEEEPPISEAIEPVEVKQDGKKRKKSAKGKPLTKAKQSQNGDHDNAASIVSLVEVLKLGGCFTQKELLAAFNDSLENPTKAVDLLFAIGLVDEKLINGAKLCQSMLQDGNLKPQQAAYVLSSMRSGRLTLETALEEVGVSTVAQNH